MPTARPTQRDVPTSAAREALEKLRAKELGAMIRTGSFPYAVDVEAADKVKHLGLIARYEDGSGSSPMSAVTTSG